MKYLFTILLFLLCVVAMNAQTDNVVRKRSQRQSTTTSTSQRNSSSGNSSNSSSSPTIGSSFYAPEVKTYYANGVSFQMVEVRGGTFRMGGTSEQGSHAYNDEKPVHSVTLSSYYIGKTEVTQALWKAVMDNNPSIFKGDNLPVENVSWNDCKKFISKLNNLTGRNFRMPTEAEWEFAARGGIMSKGYKYSGSSNIDEVAWYEENSGKITHPVAQKKANELGIYDMSGNVFEWCSDRYAENYYSSSPTSNPTGPDGGSFRVYRGGSWNYYAMYCRLSHRHRFDSNNRRGYLGLRLYLSVQDVEQSVSSNGNNTILGHENANYSNGILTVKGVKYNMIKVQGGRFKMGVPYNEKNARSNESPAHYVTLSNYSIGQTEVTQALWKAVMGTNPSSFKRDNLPVENVTWEQCIDFTSKLAKLTGHSFRLPTEAEWEFAARGGIYCNSTLYSGSNNINEVAWYEGNSEKKTHPVASKKANELGIYDMSGNVWEWCGDKYAVYPAEAQYNPIGPGTGDKHVRRGGSWFEESSCRNTARDSYAWDVNTLGFRIALSE